MVKCSEEHQITNEEQLRHLLGYPSELVKNKVMHHMDAHIRDFILRSPMLFLATSDGQGACDVSPRGDEPGFVHILDDHHLVIPERPGNRRMDSLRNLLENPHAGLIFVIPSLEETLRINGKAKITTDPELMQHMAVRGKPPLLGIAIEVQECYLHCAKAFKRSRLWEPAAWPHADELPEPAKILAAHAGTNEIQVAQSLKESYEKRLY